MSIPKLKPQMILQIPKDTFTSKTMSQMIDSNQQTLSMPKLIPQMTTTSKTITQIINGLSQSTSIPKLIPQKVNAVTNNASTLEMVHPKVTSTSNITHPNPQVTSISKMKSLLINNTIPQATLASYTIPPPATLTSDMMQPMINIKPQVTSTSKMKSSVTR